MEKEHTCHASQCSNPCPPTHLMCKPCWELVSPATKKKVYSTYTSGQCNHPGRIKPAWFSAVRQAVKEVRERKANPPAPPEIDNKRTLF